MRIAAAQPTNAAADATAAGAAPSAADGGFAALLAAALPVAGTDAIAAPVLAGPPATEALPLPLQTTIDTEDETPQADAALQALLAGVGLLPRGDAPAVATDKPADAPPLLTEASTALPASGATASLPSEATALPKAESDTRAVPKPSHASVAADAAKPVELPANASQTAHAVQAAHAESPAKDLQETPALMNIGGTAVATSTALHPSQAVIHVAEPLGTHRWEQAFSTQVVWAAREQLQSASLTLNPPELGPVRIELQLSDNQASASFSSPQPEVRKAIEDALPGLKTLFADAGLQLQHANVGSGDTRQEQGQSRPAPFAAARSRGRADDAPLAAVEAPQTLSRRLLDTFA